VATIWDLEERIPSADFEVLEAWFSLCVARFVVCVGPHTNLVVCATGHLTTLQVHDKTLSYHMLLCIDPPGLSKGGCDLLKHVREKKVCYVRPHSSVFVMPIDKGDKIHCFFLLLPEYDLNRPYFLPLHLFIFNDHFSFRARF